MYATGNKKILNMLILQLLETNTDENHSLSQQEIVRLLNVNYGMACDRRSVKNNIMYLKELGYDISMEHGYRLLSRTFDEAELRMLIDSVLFSKGISTKQAQGLIKKLQSLASKYFKMKVSYVINVQELQHSDNRQVMYTVDALNDAIEQKLKVSFTYNDVGLDFKLKPRRKMPYIVNPYQIVAGNGWFYLIGNVDRYDDVAHFRIDRMTNVIVLEEGVKPMKEIPELKEGLNLPKHMAEHIYMFSGESVIVKMQARDDMMNDLTDWFGHDFSILEHKAGKLLIRLTCNEDAMRYWALQFGPYVEILEPESLRNQLLKDVEDMVKKYQKMDLEDLNGNHK